MPMPGIADLPQTLRRELTRAAGTDADAKALAAATLRVSDALAGHLAVLIGTGGVKALTARSLHLVQRNFPWLAEAQQSDPPKDPFERLAACMERQEPSVATEAAAAVLATLGDLLVTLIGETLTMGVLREAWPKAFANETQQEARNR
jgi:hypothetical protein